MKWARGSEEEERQLVNTDVYDARVANVFTEGEKKQKSIQQASRVHNVHFGERHHEETPQGTC